MPSSVWNETRRSFTSSSVTVTSSDERIWLGWAASRRSGASLTHRGRSAAVPDGHRPVTQRMSRDRPAGRSRCYQLLSWVLLLPDVRDVAVVTVTRQDVTALDRLGVVAHGVAVVDRDPRSVLHRLLVGLGPQVGGLVDR